MAFDASWHREHPMPKQATFEQRVEWHREHAQACACRTPPPDIAAILAREPDAPRSRGGGRREP